MNRIADVIVAGTGPIGLAAALGFAGAGFRVALVGPPVAREDRRTTAIMLPGLAFLGTLGLAEDLKREGAPLVAMRIIDGTGRLVRAAPVIFGAGEIGEEAFGWNIPNRHLLDLLEKAVDAHPAIERHVGLAETWMLSDDMAEARLTSGEALRAPLAVAADGRASSVRAAAGITAHIDPLPQSALALSFRHSRGHNSTCNEFHGEHGPFTQVPLPGDRSSLVWVEKPGEAERLSRLADAALSAAIETRMQSMLGRVEVEPGRQVFPLASVAPSAYGARRVALVGEAAHTIPPIGAQGMNLGLGDVRDLLTAASAHRSDPGAPAVLSAYQRARSFTVGTRSAAVGLLNASLLSSFLPTQIARGLGLATLRGSRQLRALFMREGLEAGGALKRGLAG